MSIEERIKLLCSGDRPSLYSYEVDDDGEDFPSRDEADEPRVLYLSFDVYDLVKNSGLPEWARARAVMDDFVRNGYEWPVRRENQRHDSSTEDRSLMARLVPGRTQPEEIWDFRIIPKQRSRSRRPPKQLRVFGRFACTDFFIALIPDDRDEIDWAENMTACEERWKEYFPGIPPLSGRYPNDYLSKARVVP